VAELDARGPPPPASPPLFALALPALSQREISRTLARWYAVVSTRFRLNSILASPRSTVVLLSPQPGPVSSCNPVSFDYQRPNPGLHRLANAPTSACNLAGTWNMPNWVHRLHHQRHPLTSCPASQAYAPGGPSLTTCRSHAIPESLQASSHLALASTHL
jgi:hypothetical protein